MCAAEPGEKLSERKTRALCRRAPGTEPRLREPPPPGTVPSVLLLTAGNVNYFYDRFAQRMAEALANLGVDAHVATLRDFPARDFDCCFVVGLGEVVIGHGDRAGALQKLAEIRAASRFTALWNFESMATCWFDKARELLDRVGFDILVDTNFHRQDYLVPPKLRDRYEFVHFGLTRQERVEISRFRNLQDVAERPIPWATVGHATDARIAVANYLVQSVDPSGFVYLPPLSPVTKDGPHLNEQQYQAVLRRSRFHVWCSHHGAFYMEFDRFRDSALAGGVPIKVVFESLPSDQDCPFSNFLLPFEDLAPRLREMDFFQARERFLAEYEGLPTLEAELLRFFHKMRARGALAAGLMELSQE